MFVKSIKNIIYAVGLLTGLLIYISSKKTPAFAYQSMIHMFCITRGRSSDWLSGVIGFIKRPYDFGNSEGALGVVAGQEREKILSNLNDQGYHVFDARLSDEKCDRLLEFALSNPCTMRPMDGEGSAKARRVVYPRGKPETVRYDFTSQDLLDNRDVQSLLADISFPAVAQDYLGARPVLDVLGMWWHTAYSDVPDMDAAQFYHFDMDRPKWLKFFIYITDVESTNGPHTFVAGSHKSGGIPSSMLKKGYARLKDDEVESAFDKKNIIEFAAPRGTIIAEDTRGLHKGKHVEQGDRLILQIQFSNSLFGGYYPKAAMKDEVCEKLKSNIAEFPDIYAAYL
jgi:hypothetical protein